VTAGAAVSGITGVTGVANISGITGVTGGGDVSGIGNWGWVISSAELLSAAGSELLGFSECSDIQPPLCVIQ
jgi:hypothetical protein